MVKLTQNKGVILIATILVSTVLFILSGAYVTSSMVQNMASQRQRATMQAFYAAEKGIEYAFIESQNQGYNWRTHSVDGSNNLIAITVPVPTTALNGATINGSGNYQVSTPFGIIEVKAYADPLRSDETIVLSRGRDSSGNTSRIIKYRISRRSLYKNFMFWPQGYTTSGSNNGKQMDGQPIGSIHVNGNIAINSGTYTNFSQLRCSGNLYYNNYTFNAPYYWDRTSWNDTTKTFSTAAVGAVPDGLAPIPRYGGPNYNLYFSPHIFKDVSMHFYGNDVTDDWNGPNPITTYGSLSVNGQSIPKQLPGSPTPWSWRKYSDTRYGSEQGVKFQVTNTELQALLSAEETNGEYTNAAWTGANWLSAGDTSNNNGRFENSEADKVTLLSQETESGSLGFDLGKDKGLHGHSEYEVYKAVKQHEEYSTFPSGTNYWVKLWIAALVPNRNAFFDWWKGREYHHKENLTQTGSVYHFATDSVSVPAHERLFWEAWVNYWPPANTVARPAKSHNQSYSPSQSNQALNAEWWQDLKYGNDRESAEAYPQVSYLNSQYQPTEFRSWLQSHNLENVIQFGVPTETPLSIQSYYSEPAQHDGLYIKETGGTFTVAFNGVEVSASSLSTCLSTLGIDSWVTTAQFYNPVEANVASYTGKPPAINAIQIDFQALQSLSNNINNHIIYVEAPSYDTRLVNGATLPQGGVTLVSPYDVYVKAQDKMIDGTMRSAFNYEASDKTTSGGADDSNWQPAAIITNSKVYYLSSQFTDFSSDVPYADNFPREGDSLREETFREDYCYANYPSSGMPPKPASKDDLTWDWIQTNLTSDQQKTLYNNGESHWDTINAGSKINTVTKQNNFNIAVAAPKDLDPRGYFCERWQSGTSSAYNEGSFIALNEKFSTNPLTPTVKPSRSHIGYAAYEQSRFGMSGAYAGTRSYFSGSRYLEYEERFWSADSRPSGDFYSGSTQRWEEVTDFDHHSAT